MNATIEFLTPLDDVKKAMVEAKEKEERWRSTYWSPAEAGTGGGMSYADDHN